MEDNMKRILDYARKRAGNREDKLELLSIMEDMVKADTNKLPKKIGKLLDGIAEAFTGCVDGAQYKKDTKFYVDELFSDVGQRVARGEISSIGFQNVVSMYNEIIKDKGWSESPITKIFPKIENLIKKVKILYGCDNKG